MTRDLSHEEERKSEWRKQLLENERRYKARTKGREGKKEGTIIVNVSGKRLCCRDN